MGFVDAVRTCLSKYASFAGRGRRAEYWWFVLFFYLALCAGGVIDGAIGTDPLVVFAVYLGLMLPAVAALVRRLHDTGRSGWWWLVTFVPVIGGFVLLILLCLRSQPGWNRWGPPTVAPWERRSTGQPEPVSKLRSA